MRFPSPRNTYNKLSNRTFNQSVAYLCKNRQALGQFGDIESFALRNEFGPLSATHSEKLLKGCEHHLLNLRNATTAELSSRSFFVGNTILDDVLFRNFTDSSKPHPVISALEEIRDAGVLHPGVYIFPLHSLGVIGGGILQSYTDASVSFFVNGIDIVVTPQTNSFSKSLSFIERATKQLGVTRKLPRDLLQHWYRSRSLKWIERNPLLVGKLHSFPGDYYENQLYIMTKIKTATACLLMLNAVQKHKASRAGFNLSSSRVNNWETLDIGHYLVLYPKPYKRILIGDCTPMNVAQATLAELSEVSAELDPRFWQHRTTMAMEIVDSLLAVEAGYLKHCIGIRRTGAKRQLFRKAFKSIEFYKRSCRHKDDSGEAIVCMAVAFEILLTDFYARGVTAKIVDRVKLLLKGTPGVRKFVESVSDLFSCRGEYLHSGYISNAVDIAICRMAYIYVLLKFSKGMHSVPRVTNEPARHVITHVV